MSCRDYWANNEKLCYLTAEENDPNPEGWPVVETLQAFLALIGIPSQSTSVVDYGCGRGRLATAFSDRVYLGLDINPVAIAAAQAAYPKHCFLETRDLQVPPAGLLLLYTVCLHLDDKEIEQLFDNAAAAPVGWILIAEIAGYRYRQHQTLPFTWNRDLGKYKNMLKSRGYERAALLLRPYERYRGVPPHEGRCPELAFQLFKQKEPT